MNRPLLCVFILLFVVIGTRAQTFQRTFGTPGDDYVRDVIQTADKGYAVLGVLNGIPSGGSTYFLKTDSLGNKQWSKTFSSATMSQLVQTADGGFIFGGSVSYSSTNYAFVVKTDALGNVTWSKMHVAMSGIAGIRQTLEGDYIAVGSTYLGSNSTIVRFDTGGNILWSGTIAVQSAVMDVVQLASDSSFVTYYFTYNSTQKFTMCRFNKSGALAWAKHMTSPGFQLGTGQGRLYENGNEIQVALNGNKTGIFSINKNGTSARIFNMCCQLYNHFIADAIPAANKGNIFVSSYNTSSQGYGIDIILGAMDSLGTLQWARTIGGFHDEMPNVVTQTTDNGFMVAGTTKSFSAGGNDIYLIKTDSLGQSGCHTTGIAFTTNTVVVAMSNYTGTVNALVNNITSSQNVSVSSPSEINYDACACYPPVANFATSTSGDMSSNSFWAEKWYWTCTCVPGVDSTSGYYKSYYGGMPDGTYTVCLKVKNSCGADSICQTFNYTYFPVGLDENSEEPVMGAYPNPFHDKLTIIGHQNVINAIEIRVINSLGSLVYLDKMEASQKTLELGGLAPGLYFIQFVYNGKAVSRKFIKE